MGEGTESAAGAESTQGALLEVVKGLRHEPPLLFGIGAGLVLVAILAATTSVAIVAIVAVVLVAALAGWLFRETRARTADERRARASVRGAEIDDDADVAVIEDEGDSGKISAEVKGRKAKIGKGARVGVVTTRRSRPRKRG